MTDSTHIDRQSYCTSRKSWGLSYVTGTSEADAIVGARLERSLGLHLSIQYRYASCRAQVYLPSAKHHITPFDFHYDNPVPNVQQTLNKTLAATKDEEEEAAYMFNMILSKDGRKVAVLNFDLRLKSKGSYQVCMEHQWMERLDVAYSYGNAEAQARYHKAFGLPEANKVYSHTVINEMLTIAMCIAYVTLSSKIPRSLSCSTVIVGGPPKFT